MQCAAKFVFLPPFGFVVRITLDEVTFANGAVHSAQGSHQKMNVSLMEICFCRLTEILFFSAGRLKFEFQ